MKQFDQTNDPEKIKAATQAFENEFLKLMQLEFGVSNLNEQFGEFYQTLSALEKVQFAESFNSFNKSMRDTKRMLEKTGMLPEQVRQALEELQKDFIDKTVRLQLDRNSVRDLRNEIEDIYSEDRKLEMFQDLQGLQQELTAARDLMKDFGIQGEEADKILGRIKEKFMTMRTGGPFEVMKEGVKDYSAELGTAQKIWYDSTKSDSQRNRGQHQIDFQRLPAGRTQVLF